MPKGVRGTGWSFVDRKQYYCRYCGRVRNLKPRPGCPEGHFRYYGHVLERHRNVIKILHRQAILAYGAKCLCCGFSDVERRIHGSSFLEVDHVKGGGTKELRRGGESVYRRLKRLGYPPGYRVLCSGCNVSMEPGSLKCILHMSAPIGTHAE